MLFPPLAGWIGPRELGAIATLVAVLAFSAIAYHRWGDQARLGVLWFALVAPISIFSGRLTFALGVALGLLAILSAQRGVTWASAILASACALATPLAGLFLTMAALAWSLAAGDRRGLPLGAAALGTALIMTLAFPEGGSEPFDFSSFAPALAVTLAAAALIPAKERLLRVGVALYAVGLVLAWLIDNPHGPSFINLDNPVGGNAARAAALFAGPLLACALWRRSGRYSAATLLAIVVPVIGFWQWQPVVRELLEAGRDPSGESAFYQPVREFVGDRSGEGPLRVEVVPAVDHWEAFHLTPEVILARGWERQLDVKQNPLFYEGRLSAAAYRDWLRERGISYVALSDGPLDYAGRQEAELLRSGTPYLRPARRAGRWRFWEVVDAQPLSAGAGRLTAIDTTGFSYQADSAGSSLLRINWTPYWYLESGEGCLREAPNGLTLIQTAGPATLRVGTRFAPWRAGGDGPVCAS